ncbi:MAG: F-type H+-transporting ATPase subunit b [Flavobacteriales bacterium]|jgi:F-type H+-transporting ATPase subunit b
MDLVTPSLGLIFWTGITFLILLVILRKAAWKPILGAVKAREESITNALESAEKARNEMADLQADNERILNEARAERDAMLKEARELKAQMIVDAKGLASAEGDKMIANAKASIENEKMAAITELKNKVAELSIEIAEKVIRKEFDNADKQKEFAGNLLKEVTLN